jgi:hypothetical protein
MPPWFCELWIDEKAFASQPLAPSTLDGMTVMIARLLAPRAEEYSRRP